MSRKTEEVHFCKRIQNGNRGGGQTSGKTLKGKQLLGGGGRSVGRRRQAQPTPGRFHLSKLIPRCEPRKEETPGACPSFSSRLARVQENGGLI